MMRSPAEISTIMPSVESSTRIEYSNSRRAWSARNSAERISVAAEPISASTLRKRAKSSTMKLPPKVTSFPDGSMSSIAPDDQEADPKRGDQGGGLRAPIGAEHQQRH